MQLEQAHAILATDMADELKKVFDLALRLPTEARAALAGKLLDSLDQAIDEDAEAEWSVEIANRMAELDSGAVKAVPWPEARRAILAADDDRTNS